MTLRGSIGIDGVDVAEKKLKDFSNAIENTATRTDKAGGIFSKALSGFKSTPFLNGVNVATSAVSGFFSDGFADARGAAQLMAQTEAVILSTGGAAGKSTAEIADYASSLSDAAGASLFGDDQIQAAQNYLLTFTNVKGAILDGATQIATDMAQALGTEPQAQALALGKALNDPVAGISALTRVGVTFTDQQKEQIRAMMEAGDVAGAQSVILAELNKEFGGSAQAAATAAGPWAKLKGQWGEIGESVSAQLLPAIDSIGTALSNPAVQSGITSITTSLTTGLASGISFITDTAVPAIISLVNAWNTGVTDGGVMGGIQAALATLGTVVPGLEPFTTWLQVTLPGAVATTKSALTTVGDAFSAVKGFIDDNVVVQAALLAGVTALGVAYGIMTAASITYRVATAAGTAATTVMTAAQTALNFVLNANPIGLVITALAGLAAGLVYAYNNSETFRNAVDAAWAAVKQFATDTMQWSQEMAATIAAKWSEITTAIGNAITTAKQYVTDMIIHFGLKVAEGVAFFNSLPDRILSAVGSLAGLLVSAGADLIQGLIDGMGDIASLVRAKITAGISGGIAGVKAFFGIKSPSKYTHEQLGVPLAEGVVNGFGEGLKGFAALGKKRIDQMLDTVAGTESYRKGYSKGRNKSTTYEHNNPVARSIIPDAAALQTDLARNFTDPVGTAITGTATLWKQFGGTITETNTYTWGKVGEVIVETIDVTQRHLYESTLLMTSYIKGVLDNLSGLNTAISNTNRINVGGGGGGTTSIPGPTPPPRPIFTAQGNTTTNNSTTVQVHINVTGNGSRETGREIGWGLLEEMRARGIT